MYMIDNIQFDNRVAECLDVLSTVMSKSDLDASYIVIYPSNDFYCISDETVIFHSVLLSNIPDMNTLYINTKYTLIIQGITEEKDEENEDEDTPKIKPDKIYSRSHYIPLEDIFIKNTIDRNLDLYRNHNYPIILQKYAFSSTEEFDPFRSLKAANGAKMYKNITDDNEFIAFPMFSGFPKLAKSDGMDLTVYKQDNKYNLVEFTIYKKKVKRNINVLFRVMNLDY